MVGFERKSHLPKEFFEKIIDLENMIIRENEIIIIENLARLYKLAVEFYSGYNKQKEEDFLYRLQLLFTNRDILNILDENSNKNRKNVRKRYALELELNLNKLEQIDKKDLALIIQKFEIDFHRTISSINTDLRDQKEELNKKIKKKKLDRQLLQQVVCRY